MMNFKNSASLCLALGVLLGACGTEAAREDITATQGPKPQLGLMTSLPLYWPIDADFAALASGEADVPAQRSAFEHSHELVLLDTLSPTAGVTPQDRMVEPLSDLEFLAVIQPRVLTPTDNVALDNWVRDGGQLLLVLDPMLDGHYPLPLGDPRRPVETALIPPVLSRWGLEVRFDGAQAQEMRELDIADTPIPLALTGELREITGPNGDSDNLGDCEFLGEGAMANCTLGKGRVTILADAEVFKGDMLSQEHDHGHGDGTGERHSGAATRNAAIQALVRFAFETE